ncbi:MAG: hypothetical protein HC819_01100 [Cyclobacteriaceae bacterium]|nr:hypothetical protein [Cyclobacteriaceae bacterium]
MDRLYVLIIFVSLPMSLFGHDNEYDTLAIKPIGVEYSKYPGINKLYIVGQCEGMEGNQVVVFQNRPSFDFFENDNDYQEEQSALEKAMWAEILDHNAAPILVKGRWHQYSDRMVFLCNQIIRMNKLPQPAPLAR